ncbi:MAG: type VII toxin-antitoxin system MntA family adenylyltransferase antitoxin [Pseudanabaena sp.]
MNSDKHMIKHFNSSKDLALQIREEIPYLKMLVLFGSRARGDYREDSDYDFAVLYDEDLQESLTKDKPYGFIEAYSVIPKVLGISSDRIDIVNLGHCSDVIAHFVAQDGKLLYEKEIGCIEQFKQRALMSDRQLYEIQQQIASRIRTSLARR